MTDKNDVFSTNGIWIRWLISVLLGLGTAFYFSYQMGVWTKGVESEITALKKQDSEFDKRVVKIETEGSVTLQKQVLSLTNNMSYINIALQENAKAHGEILVELKRLSSIGVVK